MFNPKTLNTLLVSCLRSKAERKSHHWQISPEDFTLKHGITKTFVSTRRWWISNVPQGFLDAEASCATNACGLHPRCLGTTTRPEDSWTQRLPGPRTQTFVITQACWSPNGRGRQTCNKDSWTSRFRGLPTLVDRTPDARGLKAASRFCTSRRLGPRTQASMDI